MHNISEVLLLSKIQGKHKQLSQENSLPCPPAPKDDVDLSFNFTMRGKKNNSRWFYLKLKTLFHLNLSSISQAHSLHKKKLNMAQQKRKKKSTKMPIVHYFAHKFGLVPSVY